MKAKRYEVDYIYRNRDELQHFGIKGMKWKHKKSPSQLLADAKKRAAELAKKAGKIVSNSKSKLKKAIGKYQRHTSDHTRSIDGKKVSREITVKNGNGKVLQRHEYDYSKNRKQRRGGPYKKNYDKTNGASEAELIRKSPQYGKKIRRQQEEAYGLKKNDPNSYKSAVSSFNRKVRTPGTKERENVLKNMKKDAIKYGSQEAQLMYNDPNAEFKTNLGKYVHRQANRGARKFKRIEKRDAAIRKKYTKSR